MNGKKELWIGTSMINLNKNEKIKYQMNLKKLQKILVKKDL